MDLDKAQSVIAKYNTENPISRVENQQVHPVKNLISTNIIAESDRVVILNKEMHEVEKVEHIINPNQFCVDYENGRIYFHPSLKGQSIEYRYRDAGFMSISAKNVFTKVNDLGEVIEYLSEFIDRVEDKLDEFNQALEDVENAEMLINQLHADVTEGKVLEPELKNTVDSANTSKTELDKSLIAAQDDIAAIKATGNTEVLIQSSQWTLNNGIYEKEVTHTLNSENLHVSAKNSDTKEAITIGYKIVDKSKILLKSDEAINMSVVLNASYYKPMVFTNVDEGEIVRARKGEASLDVKIGKIDSSLESIMINVKDYGAKGDGVTDDTDTINSVIQEMKNKGLRKIYFPTGVYMIRGESPTGLYYRHDGGILIEQSIEIHFDVNATLKTITSSDQGYNLLTIRNCSNVLIKGGTFEGDLDTHIGTQGEFGFGIYAINVQSLTIEGCAFRKFWGDGIITEAISPSYPYNEDVIIRNCLFDTNRRQAITISHNKRTLIENNIIINTGTVNGTMPMSGIDLEGAKNITKIFDITIRNNHFENNNMADIIFSTDGEGFNIYNNTFLTKRGCLTLSDLSVNIKNIKIINNIITGLENSLKGFTGYGLYYENLIIKDNQFSNFKSTTDSSAVEFAVTGCKNGVIDGNVFTDCNTCIDAKAQTDNLKISNNIFKSVIKNSIRILGTQSNNVSIVNNETNGCQNNCFLLNVTNSLIADNVFSNITNGNCIYSSNITNSSIIKNLFTSYNTVALQSTNAMLCENNFIDGNYFKGDTASIKAIYLTLGTSGSANKTNVISNNFAKYGATDVITVPTGNILINNHTV